jgi:acetyltransferase-like isoleucine patch superfamily enzyme
MIIFYQEKGVIIKTMINYLRNILRRIVFGAAASPKLYVQYLKKQGIEIGEGSTIYDPINTVIDIQNPELLKIGRKVKITSGVKILTHDFSWSVISTIYGECLGGVAPVIIGNNCFIGVNTVILKGSIIGDNVIIGAGSVVSGKIDSNSIYVGNPARKIMTLNNFRKKKQDKLDKNIINILSNINVDNTEELWKYLREYSCNLSDAPIYIKKDIMRVCGNEEKCKEFYCNKKMNSLKYYIDELESGRYE